MKKAIEELLNHLVSIDTLKIVKIDIIHSGTITVKNLICDCEHELTYYQKERGVLAPACLFSSDLFERRKQNLSVPTNWPHSEDYDHKEKT